MGRLFWKFFGFIWLAQLAGILAIGSVFWLENSHGERPANDIDLGPGASTHIDAAGAILRFAGTAGFVQWAHEGGGSRIFAIDEEGHDVLGRSAAPALIERARQLLRGEPTSSSVAEVTDMGGQRYLLFSAGSDPPQGRPPPPNIRPNGLRGLPPLGPMIATLLASLLTALLLAWYVAKPIRSLRLAFAALSSGNLGQRAAPLIGERHDELADLGRDFDRMAERLQTAMEGQRRLLHDVSHEVRSPLARLQAAVGLMRQKSDREEPIIDRIEEEIVRIDRLVADLLKLSRLEAGELLEAVEPVDLRELIFEVVTDANFEASPTGRSVVWRHEAAASLTARPEMLRGAIENIVRNALKHAPDSREIILETSVDGHSQYLIQVLDRGPGVPEAELGALFTPFYRSANGRCAEGYGLGLTIARRSIEAHGGTIRARNRPDGGLSVEIALPLPPQGGGGSPSR